MKSDGDLAKHNSQLINNYKTGKFSLSIEQIDPLTGKILRIFKNRYQAAIWIIDNGLTKYVNKLDPIGKTRCCIAGALTISMIRGNSLYGYYWKASNLTPTEFYERIIPDHLKKGSNPIELYDNTGKLIQEFFSITEAARFIKRSNKSVSKYINTKTKFSYCDGIDVFFKRKNDLLKIPKSNQRKITSKAVSKFTINDVYVESFESISQAAKQSKIGITSISDCINLKQKTAGGFKWKLKHL